MFTTTEDPRVEAESVTTEDVVEYNQRSSSAVRSDVVTVTGAWEAVAEIVSCAVEPSITEVEPVSVTVAFVVIDNRDRLGNGRAQRDRSTIGSE